MKSMAVDKKYAEAPHWYRARKIPLGVIRRYARQVAETFRPEKIILFGSRAYGRPHEDSDVDLLVVMPARNEIDQAVRIRQAIDPPFFLDLLVRTPSSLRWRLDQGDSFLGEIVKRGKVLYEKADAGLGKKSRRPQERSPALESRCLIKSASIANKPQKKC